MKRSFFQRRSFAIIVAAVFLIPFLIRGTRLALESNRNDIKDWLPADFPETRVHRWFQEHFPYEQFVLASWEGCTLGDFRLEMLAKKLEKQPESEKQAGEPWFFKTVLTGGRLMEELRARYPELSEKEVLKRLEGSLIGEDYDPNDPEGVKTCLIVTLTEDAKGKNLRKTLEKIRHLARQCGIEPEKPEVKDNLLVRSIESGAVAVKEMVVGRNADHQGIYLGGPPVDNVAIDIEGECTLFRLAILSALIGLGISWLCFRSVRLTCMIFLVALMAAGIGMASVFFSGNTVDAILLSMPSLVYVLAMSGAIHIVNYYHDAVREHGLERAPQRALAHGWLPCTLAAITTALGLGSLLASHLIPISKFGVYSAWGVIAALSLLFLLLPACLHYFPSREYVKGGAKNLTGQREKSVFVRFWHGVGNVVTRHNLFVTAACFLVMAFFAVGLTKIKTSVKLMKLFSPDAEIIHDYGWLEEQIGPLVPMEVVVRVDRSRCRLNTVQRMRMVRDVEYAIEGQLKKDVGGALSAATFAPSIGKTSKRAKVRLGYNPRDSVTSKYLDDYRDDMRAYLRVDKTKAIAGEGWDPTLAELGVSGHVGELLAAEKLDTLSAIEAHGRLETVPDLSLAQVAQLEKAIAVWRSAHPDPTLEDLEIAEDVAELLQAEKLATLRSIEQYCGGQSVKEKLESIEGIGPEHAADVAATIDQWRMDHGQELWRVSARVKALTDLDYSVFVNTLRDKVEKVLDEQYRVLSETDLANGAEPVQGVEVVYTGLVPLVYKAQHELMNGLYTSLQWAFVLIGIVMILLLRSALAGLVAMIPNLFPVVLIFGAMGWIGILVDVGTMMTASVALGVAVDDTIHFLTWFRRSLDEGYDRKGAVMRAYERCGTAMTQTTLIGGLGLSVFAFSTFTPTQRFGVLMLTLLAAALVGDLIFLPALLSGPVGRCFRASKKRPPKEAPPEETAEAGPDEEVVAVPIAGAPPPRHLRREPPHRSTRAS